MYQEKLSQLRNVMDNYDISNSPPSVHSANARERYRRLTDEQNRQAAFSSRSTTVITTEQAKRQKLPSTGDEQIPKQRVLGDFEISLAPIILDLVVAGGYEDPFTALAAYQPLTSDENSHNQAVSELGLGSGLLEGFTAEDLTDLAAEDITDAVMAATEENDNFEPLVQPEQREQPEQSQGESKEKGIVVPEIANPDTLSGKRSHKRYAFKRRSVVIRDRPTISSSKKSTDAHFQDSLRLSERLTLKRHKPDSTDTESSLILPEMAVVSQSAAVLMSEKSEAFRNCIEQSPDESLRKRVKEETERWVVVREGLREPFMCGFPDCGNAYNLLCRLKTHIFSHIRISVYKCTHPECTGNRYFRDAKELKRHVLSRHTSEKPYLCTICNKRYRRLENCKLHQRREHKPLTKVVTL